MKTETYDDHMNILLASIPKTLIISSALRSHIALHLSYTGCYHIKKQNLKNVNLSHE